MVVTQFSYLHFSLDTSSSAVPISLLSILCLAWVDVRSCRSISGNIDMYDVERRKMSGTFDIWSHLLIIVRDINPQTKSVCLYQAMQSVSKQFSDLTYVFSRPIVLNWNFIRFHYDEWVEFLVLVHILDKCLAVYSLFVCFFLGGGQHVGLSDHRHIDITLGMWLIISDKIGNFLNIGLKRTYYFDSEL